MVTAKKTKKVVKKAAAAKRAAKAPTAAKTAAPSRAPSAKAPARALAAAANAPASGPLTLDEARALAAAKRPQVMARRAMAAAGVPAPATATPGSVGQEREKLRKAQDAEVAQRVRDYKETMALLKKRGARSPARAAVPKGAGRMAIAGAAAPAGFVPLQILAEGDSWFDYPPFPLKGGLVPRIERRLGVPILSLAKAGDEVRYMLGVKQYKLLAEHLSNGCPAGGAWDALLFSGGGNDIVDNPMALWIRDWDPAQSPEAHLNTQRFASALSLVKAGYEDLIALRDRLSPSTVLVFHAYDFAIPDGRGVCLNALGPWLKPAFDLRGFPTRDDGFAVVKLMLTEFAKMLAALAKQYPKVHFINGQGLLPQTTSSWHNELHPSSNGYDSHADNFQAALKALFPTRVA